MAAVTKSMVTTDHEEIRGWAAARGAKPAATIAPQTGDEAICLSLPDDRSNGSREISWRAWFKKFEEGKLALLYQYQTPNGERSNFHKVVRRKIVDEVEAAVGGKGRSASRKSSRLGHDGAVIAAPQAGGGRSESTRSVGADNLGKKFAATGIMKTAMKLKSAKDVFRRPRKLQATEPPSPKTKRSPSQGHD